MERQSVILRCDIRLSEYLKLLWEEILDFITRYMV